MKRAVWIGLLAVSAFAAILIVRLPASWFAGSLPAGVSCAQITGTVWIGACGGLNFQSTALGDLNWRLRPGGLLRGKLVAQVEIEGPAGTGTAEIETRSGKQIVARGLRAHFPLNPALMPSLPPAVQGSVQTDVALLRLEDGVITGIEGRVDLRDLDQGDYFVTFPPGNDGEPVGDVRSMKGPLDVNGKLRLTREPGFVLEGQVKPKADAPPQLVQELGALGIPDAQGWRPFSVAGTF